LALDTVQNYNENGTGTEHTAQELPQREEWMLLADLVPGSFVTAEKSQQIVNSGYNWQNDRLNHQESQIREMSSWLKTNKEVLTPRTVRQQNIDLTTFSDMQKCAYDIIKAHSEQPYPKDPLLLIIIGCGGTGKSYLCYLCY